MTKSEQFKHQLANIDDLALRDVITVALEQVSEEFYLEAAASKFGLHPNISMGDGGLVRHTKLAVLWAHEMLAIEQNEALAKHKDAIYAALILHDSCKRGVEFDSPYAVENHPTLAKDFFLATCESLGYDDPKKELVASAIESHMGQWNKTYKTKVEILPKPVTEIEKFVHLCDYLASRNFSDIKKEVLL